MLKTLRRIILQFSQEPELEASLQKMVSQVKEAMSTECCSIYLADHQTQTLRLMASDGLAKDSIGQVTFGFSEGLTGLVAQREEPINIANAKQHPRYKHTPEVQEEELNSFLGTPIIHQRKVLGVISVQQSDARYFDENEEAFIVTLAAQLASTLVNAEVRGLLSESSEHSLPFKNLSGIGGSPGVAMGPVVVCHPRANLANVALKKVYAGDVQSELFKKALHRTKLDFHRFREQLNDEVSKETLDVFEMYMQLLDSGQISDEIEEKVRAGWCASSALKQVVESYVLQFEALDDPYIRERASDIRDLGNRVLYNLLLDDEEEKHLPDEFILLAEEVTATMLGDYQHRGLQGIISLKGSSNSHVAILARALGIPAVMGVAEFPIEQLDTRYVIVDGYSGEVLVEPNANTRDEYKRLIVEEESLSERVAEVAQQPAITPDGKSIELLLNAGLSSGFEYSLQSGAVGIGLYRTEITFMNRNSFPPENEQVQWYKDVLSAFERKPVVMRTLDFGGDKSLPYFPIEEENPFLGWRGIRITLDHPEIFLVQVRAMIKANIGYGNLEIMLPMISGVTEVDDALRLINQAYFEICSEFEGYVPKPKVGIMIETPGAIYQLKELAARVDFLSVGSNDLTQYLLAVDRNNNRVASLYDSYHPAVIRALNEVAVQAQNNLIPLSLCGELASEPGGALLLLAMGYDKLSMNAHNIARIKWVIRRVEYQRTKNILSHCLSLSTGEQIRTYLNEQLEKLGLGGLIRAGM